MLWLPRIQNAGDEEPSDSPETSRKVNRIVSFARMRELCSTSFYAERSLGREVAHVSHSTSNSELNVREATDFDIDHVVSFHNQNYKDRRTPSQWLWQYKTHNPDHVVFTVVEDEDRIVGTQGMIPIHLTFGVGTYLSGKSESSLLDPEYRGGKTFQELYDFAMSLCKAKGMCCVWGLTTAIEVWRRKLLFSVHTNTMYTAVSVLNLRPSVRTSCRYLYAYVRRHLSPHEKSAKRRRFSIEQHLRSYRDLDHLYQRLAAKHANLIYIRQDEDYFTWRISNNPNARYMTHFLYENDLLQSYCYINTANQSTAYLTDFTFVDDDAGSYLLQEALEKLQNMNVVWVSFLGNAKNPLISTVFNLLKKFGFIKRRSPLAVVIKNINCEEEKTIYDVRNWYLNGLWTEGYTW